MNKEEQLKETGEKLKKLNELSLEEQAQVARTALRAMADAIVETIEQVNESNSLGVPAGVLYAAMSSHGCSLEMFTLMIDSLVDAGRLERKGHLLFAIKAPITTNN
jgi:hypothetical protein